MERFPFTILFKASEEIKCVALVVLRWLQLIKKINLSIEVCDVSKMLGLSLVKGARSEGSKCSREV